MAKPIVLKPIITHQDYGREAILKEAKALEKLAYSLDHTFDDAVNLISQTKGRLVISGVGKSGHIGKKISATFSSTGQPSFFLHAGEAGHGDLGMIVPGDCLILISYSGETQELTSIIHYAHRFSVPIIAITGKKNSTLQRFSTISLLLPSLLEACPMGLAPTTSSTLTLAMGDALAIACLENKGFTENDFRVFHPSGNLGKQLKKVSDYMHTENLPLVSSDSPVNDCLKLMSRFGCVGIREENKLIGIITDGDLRRHFNTTTINQKAKDIMTPNPITIAPYLLMADALVLLQNNNITSLFVVDSEKNISGLLHIHDCLKNNTI